MESVEDTGILETPLAVVEPSTCEPIQSSVSVQSTAQLFIPQVKNDLVPKADQHFENLESVKEFYNNYAREAGFSTRTGSSKKHPDSKETVRQEYLCYKEGVRKGQGGTVRPRGMTREGCRAKMAVVKDKKKGGFSVSVFVEEHNHSLTTPSKVHLFPSHREVTKTKKDLIQQLDEVNVPPHQQMAYLELQAGGFENVGCTQRDIYNFRRDGRKEVEEMDAEMLQAEFESEKEKNPDFTYTIEIDDEGRLSHCFWADATCRRSYEYFGDVVVFDTTYNSNKYCLIFAPLLGVNHHRQTTLFGCAFLPDETSASFEWLFRTWLKVMPRGPPKMIITDQDAAMTKAIATVLPNTHHRYCIWHISMKFSEKIHYTHYVKHKDNLLSCIYNCETPEEFEGRWAEVVDKSELSTNGWLKGLYQIRERWVPVYMQGIFSAHMTSSQRAEISHAFFKRYVSNETTLTDFLMRFRRALARLRHNEVDLDHKDVNEKPNLKSPWSLESQMSEVYTLSVFKRFQEQVYQEKAYAIRKMHEEDSHCVYTVKRAGQEPIGRARTLLVGKSTNFVTCSCKLFERDGIPCRHMLRYFSVENIFELPECYILPRWTQNAKSTRVRVRGELSRGVEECDNSVLMRRNKLSLHANRTIDEAAVTEEGTEMLDEALYMVDRKIAELKRKREEDGEGSCIRVAISIGSQPSIKEPLRAKTKGSGKRLKGGKEISMNKSNRKCSICKSPNHDARTCPSKRKSNVNDENDGGAANDDDRGTDDGDQDLRERAAAGSMCEEFDTQSYMATCNEAQILIIGAADTCC